MNPDWIISAQELQPIVTQVQLLDVREQEEFDEMHIAGCKLIPLGELNRRAETELSKDRETIVYCAHGVRSLQGLMLLRTLGFEKLRSLEGGICSWEEQGLPVQK